MTTYDNAQLPAGQQYDTPVQRQDSGILDFNWVKSLNGILKASEIGLTLILVITSSVWDSKLGTSGGGWVQFVSTTALICTAILYVLYFVSVAEKLRGSIRIFSLVELIYNASVVLCLFISAIIACVYGYQHSSIVASAFVFCFVIVDATSNVIKSVFDSTAERFLSEFGYYGGVCVCLLISAIIAAVFGWRHPSIAASAVFLFAALVPYGIDTFFSFQTYRNQTPPPAPPLPAQQTPGSIDTMERGPQY